MKWDYRSSKTDKSVSSSLFRIHLNESHFKSETLLEQLRGKLVMVRSKKKSDSPFASNLKKLLAERNLTQKQAAIICEVNASVINDWSNGTSPHDLIAVAKLAKALNTDFQKLLTSIPSSIENASLTDIFNIEDESLFSGIFELSAKRLTRKKTANHEGSK